MSHSLKKLQNEFSAAARGHSNVHFDDTKINIYKELILNNLNEVISPCFPMIRSIISNDLWKHILKQFLLTYSVKTAIFHELPLEFVKFLKQFLLNEYPFLPELAHYEWVELDVELSQAPKVNKPITEIDIKRSHWSLPVSTRLLNYHYEVHQINAHNLPEQPTDTYLIVYQDVEHVGFQKINQMSYQLLTILCSEKMSLTEVISSVVSLYPNLSEELLLGDSTKLLKDLYKQNIIHASI